MSSAFVIGLCFASALFYTAAAVVMKLGVGLPFLWILAPVLIALALAARVESTALQGARIGHVVVLIIGFETICTALFAVVILRESYSLREAAGVFAILVGAALLAEA